MIDSESRVQTVRVPFLFYEGTRQNKCSLGHQPLWEARDRGELDYRIGPISPLENWNRFLVHQTLSRQYGTPLQLQIHHLQELSP